MKKPKTPTKERVLKQLAKREKEMGYSPFTDNRTPLNELVQLAEDNISDERLYWRYWKIFYIRVHWLYEYINPVREILDIVNAPLYLEEEMKKHNYAENYN